MCQERLVKGHTNISVGIQNNDSSRFGFCVHHVGLVLTTEQGKLKAAKMRFLRRIAGHTDTRSRKEQIYSEGGELFFMASL